MAETENMEEVKRAYAEMILETAKEAATRVMSAELKARRFEEDLVSTKEESARILLRTKLIIDSKNKAAETTLLNQQRKFDELESQLNEAEGVILNLRDELDQAREELAVAKKKLVNPLRQNKNAEVAPEIECSGHEVFTQSLDCVQELINSSGKSSCSNGSALDDKSHCPDKLCMEVNLEYEVYSGHDHLAFSHVEKPELFGNGFVQRICETDVGLVNETLDCGDRSNPCTKSPNTENMSFDENASIAEESIQHEKIEAVPVVRRTTRKRKLKSWDSVIAACGGVRRSYQFKKLSQLSTTRDQSHIKESLDAVEDSPTREIISNENLLGKDMELKDVLVQQDELSAKVKLDSASSIACDATAATETKASNIHQKIKNTENLSEKDMELKNVVVQQDEFSSARIVCDVDGATEAKAPTASRMFLRKRKKRAT